MRRGLVNALLFIYLALLPIGFNYGWLFQVRNRHASKTEMSFLFFRHCFCWDFVHWGMGAGGCMCVCVSACVKSFFLCASLFLHLSICMCTHTFVIDEHLFVCVLACALPCMCRIALSYFPSTAATGLDWCVTQAGTLKGERPGQTWSC